MGSRAKSVGRLARSVEMITQRPVTGSFLSSGTNESFHRTMRRWEEKRLSSAGMNGFTSAKYVFYDKVKAFLNKVICRGIVIVWRGRPRPRFALRQTECIFE